MEQEAAHKMAQADLSVRRGCMADVALYWRGLRLFWDPRGRSTRTELAMLALIPILLAMAVAVVVVISDRTFDSLELFIFYVVVALPIPAAAARRFHDMGRSGWLALLLFPLLGVALWDAWLNVRIANPVEADLWLNRSAQEFIFWLVAAAYFFSLMLAPDPGINRYGSNPRPPQKVI